VLPKNAISITGAGDAVYDEIAAPLEAVHIYLRQEIVDAIADEFFMDGSRRRQIRSSFGLDDTILQRLLAAIRLSLDEQPANRLKMDYLSQALAAHLLTKHSGLGPAKTIRRMSIFNVREIGLIVDYIAANLSSNMSIDELAEIVGLGRAQFSARFKATTSMTPHQFVIMKRINRARKLLVEPRADYAFIAMLCGFASWAHFISTFKRATGTTPHEYRRLTWPKAEVSYAR
jgi:AraC family transcriptional regulator